MKNSKELISSYLSKLNNYPLLTKDEEVEIAKKLDKNETAIIKRSATSTLFLQAILSSKKKLVSDHSYLFKLLKNVEGDSLQNEKEDAYAACQALFIKIENYLEKPIKGEKELILSSLLKLALTNFAITSFIKPIEETCKILKDYEKRTKHNYEVLQVNNAVEYNKLVYEFYENSAPKNSKIINALNDQEEISNYYLHNRLTPTQIKVIKTLGSDIVKIKRQVEADRNKLITSNLRLVVSRVRLFLNKGLDFDDLIQEGNIGLMKAIDKYDYQRGIKFGTYATWWIDQTIQRGGSNKSRIIRVPIYLQDLIPKVERAVMELEAENGKTPTIEEICKHSELTKEQVSSIISLVGQPISIETQISQDLQLKDMIIDMSEDNDPYNSVSKKLLKDKIREVLAQLPESYQKILRLRFGIGESRPMNLDEIGHQVGLSKERIRQIQNEGFAKLRKKLKIEEK